MHTRFESYNSTSDDDGSTFLPPSFSFDILADNLSKEESDRLNYFNTSPKTQFKNSDIKKIIEKYFPDGVEINNRGVAFIAQAARLFTAELVETARKLSLKNEPLTPELIMLAFNQLEYMGKVPGKKA